MMALVSRPVAYGCTNDLFTLSLMEEANIDNGTCFNLILLGCTDASAYNYNPNANLDNGSCVPVIEGCTETSAFNYDESANMNDGSCVAIILGCIDPASFNFNANAKH